MLRAAFDAEPAGLSSAADVTRTIGASSGPPRGVNGPRPDAAPCDSALASAHAVLIDPTSAGDPPLPGAPTRPERPSSAAVAVTVPMGVPADRELLGWVVAAKQFTDRLEALTLALIGEAVRRDAAMTAVGCSLKSWLTEQLRVTNRAAGVLIHRAGAIGARPVLQAATLAGEVNIEQAAAIGVALGRLPEDLSTAQVDAGEATLIGYAGQFDATGLSRLGNRLVEVIAPEVADEADAKRLERERRLADRDRFLTFSHDGHGSVLLKGKMPALSAEPLIRVIDAYAEQFRRNALDRLDPLIERPSPGQRRLDALLTMVDAVQHASLAPTVGGDRPRVIVTVTYEDLLDQCTQADGSSPPDNASPPPRVADVSLRRRHPARRHERPLRADGCRSRLPARHPRNQGRPRAARQRVCVPRLRRPTRAVSRPPHRAVVGLRTPPRSTCRTWSSSAPTTTPSSNPAMILMLTAGPSNSTPTDNPTSDHHDASTPPGRPACTNDSANDFNHHECR